MLINAEDAIDVAHSAANRWTGNGTSASELFSNAIIYTHVIILRIITF
jgi:hypothetical protein